MRFKVKARAIGANADAIRRQLPQLIQKGYNFFVRTTPIDTGNARKKTKLVGDVIDANYKYSVPLNEGHSKQAPDGMTNPTIKYLKKLARQIVKGK